MRNAIVLFLLVLTQCAWTYNAGWQQNFPFTTNSDGSISSFPPTANVGISTTNPDANLYVDGSATINGPLTILGSGDFQLLGNFGQGVVPGAYGFQSKITSGEAIFEDTNANTTAKVMRLGTESYTTTNNPFLGMVLTAGASANDEYLGGGSGLGVAATTIHFNTAPNSTTNTGTQRMVIDIAGNVGVGTFANTATDNFYVQGTSTFKNNVTLANITGSAQCLHVNSSGVISGTASDCGGSGSTPGGGTNAVQYNSAGVFSGIETVLSNNGTNVGIGTVNGLRGILDVRGSASISTNLGIGTTAPGNLFSLANGIISSNGNATTITSAGGSTDIFAITGNAATGASGIKVSSSGTGYTGTLGSFTLSGNNAGVTGNAIFASTSGASATGTTVLISDLGAGNALQVNDSSADGTPFIIDATGNVGIGTTTSLAKLAIWGAGSALVSKQSTAPTVANNDCGTTAQGTIVTGSSDLSGVATVGTLNVTSCAVTFNGTFNSAPNCLCQDDSNVLAVRCTATTTKLTITSLTSMSGDNVTWFCPGNS